MDKYEEWIKKQIEYYEINGDELLFTADEVIIAFNNCLKKYKELKQ